MSIAKSDSNLTVELISHSFIEKKIIIEKYFHCLSWIDYFYLRVSRLFINVLTRDWKEFAAHSWWCFKKKKKGSSEWIKGCNFHAISAQFSFLLMFSFFEMAMIAIQFCPHSTAGLNEPFITNFLSFRCLRFYLLRNLFFLPINVYHSSCITITFSNYYL